MKKIILVLIIFILSSINNQTLALKIVSENKDIEINTSQKVTRTDIFNFYAKQVGEVPKSYKYIKVNYKNIEKGSELEDSLKKLLYLDLITNIDLRINKNSNLNAYYFYKLSEKILNIKIVNDELKKDLLLRDTYISDLNKINNNIGVSSLTFDTKSSDKKIKVKKAIFKDVYKTITSKHYNRKNLDETKIIDAAISGITKGTEDKHTVYFPPVESKIFKDNLSGKYEGIGAYVEMSEPGVLRIISPIPGSPAEKAGIKGGDLVIKVDGNEITVKNSLKEAVSWIKGPSGSIVKLTILRKGKEKIINVTRGKIVITDIESKKIGSKIFYIQIKNFGDNVSSEFKETISKLNDNDNRRVNRIILDLRNNGGGYLDEVTKMLSYFIPEGKKTAVIKYIDKDTDFISKGYGLVDFSKYKIVILQNSGTASASEILIGTLKDYYPNISIVGEKSYGKGSVQLIKKYTDGSALKYTTAKWFTGGTSTGIDGIGIEPTMNIEFDLDKFNKNGFDNQLNNAKTIR